MFYKDQPCALNTALRQETQDAYKIADNIYNTVGCELELWASGNWGGSIEAWSWLTCLLVVFGGGCFFRVILGCDITPEEELQIGNERDCLSKVCLARLDDKTEHCTPVLIRA
uniref:Uncharacterized protein n=1 Tax=Romanomermis culicivorax TaxID=13658 RepID=A0A915HI59_ROMCU